MQVKIFAEIEGQKLAVHTDAVTGTLEQMEERVLVLTRSVGRDVLQGVLNAATAPRPPFRPTTASCGTRVTQTGRSSGCLGR